MKHIKTPVRYDPEDWMLFDADDQWLASFDAGEVGPEIAAALNAHATLAGVAEDANEMEAIFLSEIQRLCGPDAELASDVQGKLHCIRQRRYAALALIEEPE